MLLKNCRLIDGTETDIWTMGDQILEVARDLSVDNEQVLDCKGNLVAPGFIDCHMHLDKTMIAIDTPNESGTLDEAIAITRLRKQQFTINEVKERARVTLEKAIAAGTTRLRTNVDVDPLAGLVGLEALLELRDEYRDRVDIQLVAFPQEGINKSPGTVNLLEEALRLGADVLGGIPAKDTEPALHIQKIFDLAEKYGVPLDIHTDESDDPEDLTILEIAEQVMARGLQGRVTVAHCCSLAALPPERLEPVLQIISKAKLNVVSLPSTNLNLQGRWDSHKVRRGIAPVRRLLEQGINVAFASDNVRDAFNPFGNANLVQVALLAAHGCHMGGTVDLKQIFTMITTTPGMLMGIDNTIKTGNRADLVLLSAKDCVQAIIEQAGILDRIFRGISDRGWAGI